MQNRKVISGFSKLHKEEKLNWLVENYFDNKDAVMQEFKSYWHHDEGKQRIFDGFSENTLTNFYMPYGVAPNFIINGKTFAIPMVIEESSVVAAASSAAKYWMTRGGFHAEVLSTTKVGQVHFLWLGEPEKLVRQFSTIKTFLREHVRDLTQNMEARGGGILDLELIDMTHLEANYFQIRSTFETCDSMGANFINSVLEAFGEALETYFLEEPVFIGSEKEITIIMAILSNYTPSCLVRASVECPIKDLGSLGPVSGEALAEKFCKAIKIARIDPYRAVTHNKGIYNGVDAVVLATGNDFRAIEACGHAYAARDGQYRSLSFCTTEGGVFKFWLDLPLAIGTVGGLTKLHPVARRSLELLGNPSAPELMEVIAAAGLAQNFAAVKSLVTTGIQKGHMKMHLVNILNHLEATKVEMEHAIQHFSNHPVSFNAVRDYLNAHKSQG